jgi:hypothetical protein
MNDKCEVPSFKTEAEEAEWWFEHREAHDARMQAAIEGGVAQCLADVLFEHGLRLDGLKEVAVPVEEEDVALARLQAASVGMDYHEYMGKLLRNALRESA